MRKGIRRLAIATLALLLGAVTLSTAAVAAAYISLSTGDPGAPGDGKAVTLPPGGLVYGLAEPLALGACSDGITVTVFPADSNAVFNGPEDFVGLAISSPGIGSTTGVAFTGTTVVNGTRGYYFNVSQSLLAFIAQVHAGATGTPTTVADLTLNGVYFGLDFGAAFVFSVDAIAIGCGQSALPPVNSPPVVDAIVASATVVPVGASFAVSADFIDPDAADTFTIDWDWGDGSHSAGSMSGDNASQTATALGTHAYSTAGVYTVKVRVTDSFGAAAEATYQYIVAYDPSEGYVTGGGWFDSPAGAFRDDPTAAGKATFGFVARYQRGATVPTGNTEFQFKAGNLTFRSSAYEWLVVAGAGAKYKGYGSINGAGNFRFMITARDGDLSGSQADAIRIRIWRDASDTGTASGLVYDNQYNDPSSADATTALGGGSIVIHR